MYLSGLYTVHGLFGENHKTIVRVFGVSLLESGVSMIHGQVVIVRLSYRIVSGERFSRKALPVLLPYLPIRPFRIRLFDRWWRFGRRVKAMVIVEG